MTYWDHIERVCNLSVLPLLFSMLEMWHDTSPLKSVYFLQDRKTRMLELCLFLFFSAHVIASSIIFRGNNMPMCLIADTHSLNTWTTLWMVTICMASTGRVFASTSAHNTSSHQCFEGSPNQNFDAEIVYDLTTESCKKGLFLPSLHHQAF